jgi:hypothetical protein
VQRPVWLAGVAASVVGKLRNAVAFGTGSVVLLEAPLTVRLPFALPNPDLGGQMPCQSWPGTLGGGPMSRLPEGWMT